MASPTWSPEEQLEELSARKRRQEADLTLSGSALGLIDAILLVEVLSLNEDTNTFLLCGLLAITMSVAWLVVAKRAGVRELRWERQSRILEREHLLVPESFSVWYGDLPSRYPTWIAVAGILVSFTVVWVGVLAYALWMTYL